MAVDKCVRQEVRTFLTVHDVHGTEMVVFRLYADDFFGDLDRIGIFGVHARDECVRFASLYHHHAEVVALEHLVVGLFECITFAGFLLGQYLGITFAAFGFAVVAQVDDFDAFQAEIEFLRQFLDTLVVTQQDRMADAFSLGFHGGFQHVGVDTLGKHHALGIAAGRISQLAGQFRLIPHQFLQVEGVSVPVFDGLAGHSAFHGSFGHSHGHLGDEARVYRFRDEI